MSNHSEGSSIGIRDAGSDAEQLADTILEHCRCLCEELWDHRQQNDKDKDDEIKEEKSDALNTVGTGTGGHFGNFIGAIRSGKQTDLTCDIEVGHRSSVLPELGNISYRLGRELTFNGSKEHFVDDNEANALLRRKSYREPYVVPDLS